MVFTKKSLLPIFLLFFFYFSSNAQIRYAGKLETSYFIYRFTTVQVEPGPNWKGYNLEAEENGVGISGSNGITVFDRKLYAGVGLGYLDFKGIKGYSLFSEINYSPFKTKINPFLNLKVGYSHINNQYVNGTSTALVDIGAGLNFNFSTSNKMFLQSGLMFTQQAMLFPITLGFKF